MIPFFAFSAEARAASEDRLNRLCASILQKEETLPETESLLNTKAQEFARLACANRVIIFYWDVAGGSGYVTHGNDKKLSDEAHEIADTLFPEVKKHFIKAQEDPE